MSRLMSVLSAIVCRQTLLQRALNTSQQLVLRFTQTQPVSAKTQPLTATCCSHINGSIDPTISLFHRPTKTSIDCSDSAETADQSDVLCRGSGEVVEVCFNKSLKESLHDVQQKIREEAFDVEAVKVESVDELIYKELKTSYECMPLASLYSKLAKLKLTGRFLLVFSFAGMKLTLHATEMTNMPKIARTPQSNYKIFYQQ